MIHCQKCNFQNEPEAQKCKQCGANLLPGRNVRSRLLVLVITVFLGLLCPFLVLRSNSGVPGGGSLDVLKSMGFAILSVFIGIGLIIFGIYWVFRKTPLQERYQARAERHMDLDPRQAIADFSKVIELSSQKGNPDYFTDFNDILIKRAGMYKKLGMDIEAKSDYEHALADITQQIDLRADKWEFDLQNKLIEVGNALGKPDIEFDVLKKAIDADSWSWGGNNAASSRMYAQMTRSAIMKDGRYGIIGFCKQCNAETSADFELKCTNNPNHGKVTNPRPVRLDMARPPALANH